MEVGALKEQAAARRPSIFVVVRGDRGRQYSMDQFTTEIDG
jgi:hypothetical protein